MVARSGANIKGIFRPETDRSSCFLPAGASAPIRSWPRLAVARDTPPACPAGRQSLSELVSRRPIGARCQRPGRGARREHGGHDIRQSQVADRQDHAGFDRSQPRYLATALDGPFPRSPVVGWTTGGAQRRRRQTDGWTQRAGPRHAAVYVPKRLAARAKRESCRPEGPVLLRTCTSPTAGTPSPAAGCDTSGSSGCSAGWRWRRTDRTRRR